MAKNLLTATVQQIDDDDVVLVKNSETIEDDDPSVGEFRTGLLTDTNEATISLPIAQPRQIYVRNTHGTAKITVSWTPQGGSKSTILVLGPNDGIMFWQEATNASYGISALYLQSDTASATYRMFIGG